MPEPILLAGDARHIPLPNGSVHCVVTSPPYWGLRDYGLEPLVWGGDEDCEHEWATATLAARGGSALNQGSFDRPSRRSGSSAMHEDKVSGLCPLCGAWRGTLGLEPTPRLYVQHLVEVFREIRRILRDDGTVWLNLGDSYFGDSPTRKRASEAFSETWDKSQTRSRGGLRRSAASTDGLKPKDLIGIPWRVAFALQEDGWWLRSDIVWSKPNPMPESVRDRPTKSHEYLFLLTKSQRYFYDQDAIREPSIPDPRDKMWGETEQTSRHGHEHDLEQGMSQIRTQEDGFYRMSHPSGRNKRTVWEIPTQPHLEKTHFATFPEKLVELCILVGTSEKGCCAECGAPWERVTEVTKRYIGGGTPRASEADIKHFLKTHGTTHHSREGLTQSDKKTIGWQPTCEHYGIPAEEWDVILSPLSKRAEEDPSMLTGRAGFNRPRSPDEGQRAITRYEQRRYAEQLRDSAERAHMASQAGEAFEHYIRTDLTGARPIPADLLDEWIAAGWITRVDPPVPDGPDRVPCVVLDPFVGSGTTLRVARKHGRLGIGVDLKAEYLQMARRRLTGEYEVEVKGTDERVEQKSLPMLHAH